jgi:hypothetical protein
MDNGTDVTMKSSLEIGWMGYFLFCMTNIVLALSITLPELPVEKADDRRDQEDSRVSRQTVAYAVALAGCCYFCLLGVSMFKGTFSYDLPLPDSVWAGVPPTVHASVSLTRVCWRPYSWPLEVVYTFLKQAHHFQHGWWPLLLSVI